MAGTPGGGSGGAAGGGGTGGAGGAAGATCVGVVAGTAGTGGASSGSRLYAILNGGTDASSLEVVDAVSWTLIRNVPLGVLSVVDMEIDPSDLNIYVTEGVGAVPGNLHTLSATTGADTGSPGPPVNLGALALSPDGSRLYGFSGSMSSTTISAIDTSSMAVVDSLTMTDGWNPSYAFSLAPDGAMLAFEWLPTGAGAPSFRVVTAACKLSMYGTFTPPPPTGFDAVLPDFRSPVFTGDGRILVYETNYEYVAPFDIGSSQYEPYLKLRGSGSYLGSCIQRCVGYDPVSQTGIAHGNHYDVGSFDLVSGSAGTLPLAPANTATVRQVFARPGGGAFADVQYIVGSGVQAPPDTINDARGNVVYTFSQAKPVGSLRFKPAP